VELEASLLIGVGNVIGVIVLPPVVGVDVSTWVISVGPSTVQEERVCRSYSWQLALLLLVDVGTSPGVPVLPAVVGVVVSTWVVCVGPSTVHVYVHACRSSHNSQILSADYTCVDQFHALPIWCKTLHCWLSTDVGSTDCPHLHSVDLA